MGEREGSKYKHVSDEIRDTDKPMFKAKHIQWNDILATCYWQGLVMVDAMSTRVRTYV